MAHEHGYLKNKNRIMREIKFALPYKTIALGNEKGNFRFCRGQAAEVKPDFLKN